MVAVLVVDDHGELEGGLLTSLSGARTVQVVGTATDGRRAVELALARQPDVVVMDLETSWLDGVDTTERIVTSSPHISVVVLSSDAHAAFDALRAGARGSLPGGVDPPALVRAVEAAAAGEVLLGPRVADRISAYFARLDASPLADLMPRLTPHEREVLTLMAAGQDGAEIARALAMSAAALRHHRADIVAKLQQARRTEVVLSARDGGLRDD